MQITKCDICKKKVGSKSEHVFLWVRGKNYANFELCEKCSQLILKYLTDKKLLKK